MFFSLFGLTILWKKLGKRKLEQNSATTMISADGKGTVFQWNWNYKGNSLKKHI